MVNQKQSYMVVGVGNIKDIGMRLIDFCVESHKTKSDL